MAIESHLTGRLHPHGTLISLGGHSGYPKNSGWVIRVFRISDFQNCYPKIVRKKKNPKIRVPKNSSSGSGIPEIPDKLSNVGGDRRKRRQELAPPVPTDGKPPVLLQHTSSTCSCSPTAISLTTPWIQIDQAQIGHGAAREESLPSRGTADRWGIEIFERERSREDRWERRKIFLFCVLTVRKEDSG